MQRTLLHGDIYSRGIATITGNTIHITEAKSIQGIVEDNKEPYSDIKILVQGATADNPLNVRDINGTKAVIDKDGVYEFKDNGLYFGFGFSKVGVVDVTITQLPTSILKDLSGNGNHAYLLLLVTAKLRLEFPALTRILFLKLPTSTISKVV